MQGRFILSIILGVLISTTTFAQGNETIPSFTKAKKEIAKVYFDHRVTFYCNANFDEQGNIYLPEGFTTPKHKKRSQRKEWEHIVPAENFGRTFSEWKNGHPKCGNKNGKPVKGRKCAQKNQEFKRMEADIYNLVPAIGSVNAMRSNFNFTEMQKTAQNTFGSCPMKIQNRKAEPPDYTKGFIARTYFYFEKTYPRFKISKSMKRILLAWDKKYPVDEWECKRAERIEKIQKNKNPITEERCKIANFYN